MLIPPGEIALSLGCWLAGKAPLCGCRREKGSVCPAGSAAKWPGQVPRPPGARDPPLERGAPQHPRPRAEPDLGHRGGVGGERPGTQGLAGCVCVGLWVPVPALPCPQPPPPWPRRLAVSGAELRALSALRAGPFPPRAAAPLPSYRPPPRWRGLSRPPPGCATPSGTFLLIPFLPCCPFPKLSLHLLGLSP